ncbi:hypothetical protein BS78_09G015900 [Paspalum vaginatum]|nr:hypothetical protein BS78_09G015900 [Paspalum vaginatum]
MSRGEATLMLPSAPATGLPRTVQRSSVVDCIPHFNKGHKTGVYRNTDDDSDQNSKICLRPEKKKSHSMQKYRSLNCQSQSILSIEKD